MRYRVVALLLLSLSMPSLHAYRLIYKEQLYELYHQHLYATPERVAENVYWLEQALRADFANPLFALARIETKREWEIYRYLFTMHLNIKLTELYLQWGSLFNKFEAYFYNYPWRRENLKSLERAEELIRHALVYWKEAQVWSQRASELRWIDLEEIQQWHDESWRIEHGELDYEAIIERHLTRLARVRGDFEAMEPY